MLKKKSYMNKDNIISEGWMTNVVMKLVNNWKKKQHNLNVKAATALLSKHKGFQGSLKDLNKKTNKLEKMLQDLTGEPIKLNKYELGDFLS